MATTRFNVVLDVPLTNAQKSALDKQIQSTVRNYIAGIDNNMVLGRKIIVKKEWLGIWLKKFASLDRLKKSAQYRKNL